MKVKKVSSTKISVYLIIAMLATFFGFFVFPEPNVPAIIVASTFLLLAELRLTERDIRREMRETSFQKSDS